ncbi:MAG: protein kinase [Deltaproteobacteria bacterium]|nr:protein kinase [Deltaproteobacteria bacterium]
MVTAAPWAAGAVVAGKYRVARQLGEGAMGVVVAAEHLVLRHGVAIKFLKSDVDALALERFLQEARAMAQIGSQHCVRVLDVELCAGSGAFIVMEMLAGEDLGERIGRTGPLSLADAADLLLRYVTSGPADSRTAHGQGRHRRLRPCPRAGLTAPAGRTSGHGAAGPQSPEVCYASGPGSTRRSAAPWRFT